MMIRIVSPYGDTVNCKILDDDGNPLKPAVKAVITMIPNSTITAEIEFTDGSVENYDGVILG